MLLETEREQVAHWGRRLRPDGLVVGTAGNLSIRRDDLLVISPSGLDYEVIGPADVCVVRRDGTVLEGPYPPSTELPLHVAAYDTTPDIGAVVHTHSPYATALGLVLDELPAVHYLIAMLGGPVPVAAYATPGSAELARHVGTGLAGRSALLLRNHGSVTTGPALAAAYDHSVLLEWLAGLYARARQLGTPSLVDAGELAVVAGLLEHYRRSPNSPDSPGAPVDGSDVGM
jgi:L-fuculose-phosphate aldolase